MWRLLILMCCVSSVVVAQEKAADQPAETPEQRRESIVFQAIADMIFNRDKLLERYAVVLEGEYTDLEAEHPGIYPMLVIRCVSKKHQYEYAAQVDFKAQIQFDNERAIAGIRNLENWQECVQSRGEYKVFNGSKDLGKDYQNVGKGEDAMKAMREMGLVVPRCDPFDDFVTYSSMFLSEFPNAGSTEDTLLRYASLVSTEDLVGDEIKSTWRQELKGNLPPSSVIIKWSKANNYMPIEVSYKYTDPRDFSVARLFWKKRKEGFLLPWRIEFAHPVFVGRKVQTSQYAFKLRWLVGDELPDSVFDFKSDPRDPLLKLFGIDYEKDGQPAQNPWKVPEDLYQFDNSKK